MTMPYRRGAVAGLAALAGVAAICLTIPGDAVQAASTGENVTPVFSGALPDLPGKDLTAVVVEYAPGGRSAAHHHGGSVFAYVLEGEIRSQLDDGPPVVYRAGESFFEPPGTRHAVSENASATAPARLLAVIIADRGGEATVFEQ